MVALETLKVPLIIMNQPIPPKKESRADLISELRKNNIKFSEKDIVFIVRDTTRKIVWLENGNLTVGLKHILDGGNNGLGAFQ
jgi:hypothetical protein